MRYRKLDANDDYSFGHGSLDFFVNTPEAVGQAVETRLNLWTGQWFLDQTDGTAWATQVIGPVRTANAYDVVVTQRILSTPGVTDIASYSSSLDTTTRELTIEATIDTQYGQTSISTTVQT